MPCGKLGCRCMAAPPQLHGPYYQWTRKVRGRTVTVRLRPESAQRITEWIDNGRQLDKVLAKMEVLSLRITDRVLRDLEREPEQVESAARPRAAAGGRARARPAPRPKKGET
jgi:hypothetical protein